MAFLPNTEYKNMFLATITTIFFSMKVNSCVPQNKKEKTKNKNE